jgi:eukaryotic-like serine/threonine-protein kinase
MSAAVAVDNARPPSAPANRMSRPPRSSHRAESDLVDGRYALRERIGAGATACVYRAADLRLRRSVAVKVLHPHLADDPELVERFRLEAHRAASLEDDHLASVYDLGRWSGTHYFAMEYVAGRSLRSIIAEEPRIDHWRAIELSLDLLRAARCIHDGGIVHRDLKPENVIVDRRGRAKVIDLGIAHTRDSDLTATGSILGTARYASPEQVLGSRVTAASDLYSIGVILYELLAGKPPFEAASAVALAMKHVHEQPMPLTALRPEITPALAAAVMRSLQKDPGDRFADATRFMAAIITAALSWEAG